MTDTINRSHIITALNAIVTAIGATALLRLFTAGPSKEETSPTLSMFTEPEGTWYDPTDVAHPKPTYGDAYLDGKGGLARRAVATQFNYVEHADNEVVEIRGWFVTSADGTTVHHFGYLDQSVQLATNLDAVIVAPEIALKLPIAG